MRCLEFPLRPEATQTNFGGHLEHLQGPIEKIAGVKESILSKREKKKPTSTRRIYSFGVNPGCNATGRDVLVRLEQNRNSGS